MVTERTDSLLPRDTLAESSELSAEKATISPSGGALVTSWQVADAEVLAAGIGTLGEQWRFAGAEVHHLAFHFMCKCSANRTNIGRIGQTP